MTSSSESRAKFSHLRPNSLRLGTGKLFWPSRELNRVIRELIRLISEPRDLAVISIYINRVPEQLVHDEQGAGGRRASPIRRGSAGSAGTCRTPLRRRAPRDRVPEQRMADAAADVKQFDEQLVQVERARREHDDHHLPVPRTNRAEKRWWLRRTLPSLGSARGVTTDLTQSLGNRWRR